MKHYIIMSAYKNGLAEELDSSDNKKKAMSLQEEYKLAFGSDFNIWIEVKED